MRSPGSGTRYQSSKSAAMSSLELARPVTASNVLASRGTPLQLAATRVDRRNGTPRTHERYRATATRKRTDAQWNRGRTCRLLYSVQRERYTTGHDVRTHAHTRARERTQRGTVTLFPAQVSDKVQPEDVKRTRTRRHCVLRETIRHARIVMTTSPTERLARCLIRVCMYSRLPPPSLPPLLLRTTARH